jgi:uncharacterized phiE125 gp8 family phage protein
MTSWNVETLVAPAERPVSADVAAGDLRLDADNQEPDLIGRLIDAAVGWIERYTGRCLVEQTVIEHIDCLPQGDTLRLHRYPITSVVVKYDDVDDVEQTWSADNYWLNGARIPPFLQLKDTSSWPDLRSGKRGALRVEITGGEDAADVPEPIKRAVIRLVAHLHEHRGVVAANAGGELPYSVRALLADYRLSYL